MTSECARHPMLLEGAPARLGVVYFGLGSIAFGTTYEVRPSQSPGQRPRLLISARQHDIETAIGGSGSPNLIHAVMRVQLASCDLECTLLQTEFPGKPAHCQRTGRTWKLNMLQATVAHHDLHFPFGMRHEFAEIGSHAFH